MALKATDFIFHSDLLPLSLPFKQSAQMDTGTSLTANQTRTTYGPWIDTGPGSLGLNAFLDVSGKVYPDFLQEHPLRPGNFQPHVTVWVEKDSANKVRMVMREINGDSVTHTYTKLTVKATFYTVHIV